MVSFWLLCAINAAQVPVQNNTETAFLCSRQRSPVGEQQMSASWLVENPERGIQLQKAGLYWAGKPVDYVLHSWVKGKVRRAVNWSWKPAVCWTVSCWSLLIREAPQDAIKSIRNVMWATGASCPAGGCHLHQLLTAQCNGEPRIPTVDLDSSYCKT